MNPTTDPSTHSPVQPGRGRAPRRKLFTGGEWLTLLGMVLAVMSASQAWTRFVPPKATTVPAIYVSRASHTVAGFDLRLGSINVGWVVVAAAVVCGSLLLFTPADREKRFYLVLQSLLSLAILGLASYHFGAFAGIYLAITGALLLLVGGALRFR